MKAAYNDHLRNKFKTIVFIYSGLFPIFITCLLLISGCGSGGNTTSSINNTNPNIITPAIESILLVSPTKSGAINSIIGYPQKILVAGTDKNGSRKLLGPSDGLTFTLQNKWYGSISESGVLSSDIPGETILVVNFNNFNNKLYLTIPVKIQQTVLQTITITANSTESSSITIIKNYHTPIKAEGKFVDGQVFDISNYIDLWSSNNTNITFESDYITGANLFPGDSLGTTKISAKFGAPESSVLVHVVDAPLTSIRITPNNNDIPINSNIKMRAIGTFSNRGTPIDLDITNNLMWKIESTALATINNTTGTLTTYESQGNIVVVAKAPNGESSTSLLTISGDAFKYVFIKSQSNGNPVESITIYVGGTIIIYPYAEYYNGETEIIDVNNPKNNCKWIIESESIIDFNNGGTKATLQGIAPGDTSVTLSCQNNTLQYKTYIHVTGAIPKKLIIEPDGANEPTGKIKLPIGAHDKLHGVVYYSDGESSIVHPTWWSIQDDNIASIESSSGTLTGKSIGNTLIKTVINIDGHQLFAQESIEVSAATLQKIMIQGESSLVSGTSKTFKAIGIYSDGNELNMSESVIWSCQFPIKSCHQGIVIAESNRQESQFAQITVTDPITNINAESNINIVPVAMIALIFNESLAYSKCTKLDDASAICYIKFLAVYNDGSRKDYSDFDKNNGSSFQITPTPSEVIWPNPKSYLTIQYAFPPPPTSVTIKAKSNGFESEHTFQVNTPKG